MIASQLPQASAVSPHDQAAPVAVKRASPPFTILVIEDDATVRQLVQRILRLEGYNVLEAADGELGLRVIETHMGGLDLVLTDIDMPNIDGITVAEVLAVLRPWLGVVCMSGTVPHDEFRETMGFRHRPFLAKPFAPADLAVITADTLARSQELLAQAEAQSAATSPPAGSGPVSAGDLVAAAHRLRAMRAGVRANRTAWQSPAGRASL